MSDARLAAPFTPEQVKALNEYQRGGWMHPFTCGHCRDLLGVGEDDRALVATEAGWICRTCSYTQDWAHPFMAEGPPDWFRETAAKEDSEKERAVLSEVGRFAFPFLIGAWVLYAFKAFGLSMLWYTLAVMITTAWAIVCATLFLTKAADGE